MKMRRKQHGQSLIEILLAMGLMAIILPGLITGFVASRSGKAQQQQRLQAVAKLKEAEEQVRQVRENSWTSFANDGTFYPILSGTTYALNPCSGTCPLDSQGIFTTSVVISDVYRNSSNAIVTSGGTLDPSTKKVVTTISWTLPYSSSVSDTTYLTRHENMSVTQTTAADFSAANGAVLSSTHVTNNKGGEVTLGGGGGGGDWCSPTSVTPFDLQKSGVANAVWATEGAIYTGQGNNASGVAFQKVNVPTSQNPPTPTNGGWLNTSNPVKTNGIFANSKYAYITTDTNGSQVIILDTTQFTDPPTNSNFKQVGAINLGVSSANGVSVFVSNNFNGTGKNYAYVTASNGKLYIYDVTDPTTPVIKNSGGYQIGSSSSTLGNKILVAGTYAYIVTSSTSNPLRIVNVSNPSSPTSAGVLNLGTGQSGTDLFVNTSISNPQRAYLATSVVTGKNDFYIVNIEDPTNPKLTNDSGATLGQYNTNGMTPTGVTVVTGNKAIIVGTGGTLQYQVIDITDETTLSLPSCGPGLSFSSGVFGVSSVLQSTGYAYSYIITGDSTAELKIILGGSGGLFSSSGTFTSAPVDVASFGLSQAFFNRFDATFLHPPGTTIGIQVAAANAVNNSCTNASYTFIGPGGTTNASDVYTTSPNQIPLSGPSSYVNPSRCFEYKVYMTTTDYTKAPELDDFTLNFSP